jgi:GNAT superfamily N-acetyltransferase
MPAPRGGTGRAGRITRVLTVRERRPGDEAAVAALLAATADRVAAAEPRIRLDREPGPGPALVAVGPDGTVHGHVRPEPHEAAPDERLYAPDRSAVWAAAAVDGPDPAVALAAAIRSGGFGVEADGVLWPAADSAAADWWAAAGLEPAGHYCLRPPDPLTGALPAGVTARPAGPADADALVDLHREAIAFQARASPYVRLLPEGLEAFRTRLRDGTSTSTVLETGGRLIAVCEWWPVDAAGPPLPPGRYVYLNSVGVTAGARTGGLGRALVAAAVDAAGPDLDGSTLWFSPQNPIASRVWPHLGWRPYWTSWEHRA